MSINRVVISGNLTREPDLRQTPNNTMVLTFGVAVNDRRRNQNGEWEDVPNFVDCVVFGNRAEPLSRFLSKGSKVCIEGKLRWSQWERDGQKRSKIEVVVDEVELMSQRNNNGQSQSGYGNQGGYSQPARPQDGGYGAPQYSAPAQANPVYQSAPQPPAESEYDAEIPF